MSKRSLKTALVLGVAVLTGCSRLAFDGETSFGSVKVYKGLFKNELIIDLYDQGNFWKFVDRIPKNRTVDELFAQAGGTYIEVANSRTHENLSEGLYAVCMKEIDEQTSGRIR